jgi:hypothetical protein
MLAVYLHGLWLCSLVRRSSFRCEVAFSPSSLQKACLCMCIHNCTSRDIKGAGIFAAGEEDVFSTATKRGPDAWHRLTFEHV